METFEMLIGKHKNAQLTSKKETMLFPFLLFFLVFLEQLMIEF